jgi:hypothetical protein
MRAWSILLTILLLAVAVSSATARTFEISNYARGFRIIWGAAEFTTIHTVRCRLTLEGTLHSQLFSKISGTLVGFVTRAAVSNCEVGATTVNGETLPWHVQYRAFSGTLPAIAGFRVSVVGPGFEIKPAGELQCRMTAGSAEPAVGEFLITTGQLRRFAWDPGPQIRTAGEGAFCRELRVLARLGATGEATVLGEAAALNIALIS